MMMGVVVGFLCLFILFINNKISINNNKINYNIFNLLYFYIVATPTSKPN